MPEESGIQGVAVKCLDILRNTGGESGFLGHYWRFRSSASVTDQRVAFATGVPPHLYAFHRYTWNSTLLFCTQVPQFPM